MKERRTAFHVYNARCALTVEPSRNRAATAYTAHLETAVRADGGKDFRWDAKLVVQITASELPDVVATVLGHRADVEFLHHGPRRDKGYRLFRDADRLIVQLFEGTRGERHTVALTDADRLTVAAMLFRQLQRNHGGLPADVLYAMLGQVYDPVREPVREPPSPRPNVPGSPGEKEGASRAGIAREREPANPTPATASPATSADATPDASPALPSSPSSPSARDDPYDW